MSENEPSTGESSSEGSEDVCSSDGEDYYVFNGDFAPYQGEPLASSEDSDNGSGEDEEEDEDGILPSVLEQRLEGQVPLDNWWEVIAVIFYFFDWTFRLKSKHFCLQVYVWKLQCYSLSWGAWI